MTVAYDLRFASDHFTGIGTHADALLDALLATPGDERYVVLWNPALPARRLDVGRFARHPRVTWVERRWQPLSICDPIRLAAWLRRLAPDVFLSPFYLHPPAAGCAVALTLHDVFPLVLPEGMSASAQLLFRTALRLARRADLMLTCSTFSAGELVARGGFAADRVRTVLLGLPPRPRAVPRPPPRVPASRFALVVGENRPRKNLALLADTWSLLGADHDLALVSAGRDHARYPSLEQLARGRVRPELVRSLGWVDEAELAWLYAQASLVLYASRYEGFGFPLVEAFAAGVPVIASDIPTFHEVGGDAARYAPADDPRAWAAAVTALSHDQAARDAGAAAGFARVAALSYRDTAARTLDILRTVTRERLRDARTPSPPLDRQPSPHAPVRPAPIDPRA